MLVPDTYVRLREGKHSCMDLFPQDGSYMLDYSSVLARVYRSYMVCWNQMVDASLVHPAVSDLYFVVFFM